MSQIDYHEFWNLAKDFVADIDTRHITTTYKCDQEFIEAEIKQAKQFKKRLDDFIDKHSIKPNCYHTLKVNLYVTRLGDGRHIIHADPDPEFISFPNHLDNNF